MCQHGVQGSPPLSSKDGVTRREEPSNGSSALNRVPEEGNGPLWGALRKRSSVTLFLSVRREVAESDLQFVKL